MLVSIVLSMLLQSEVINHKLSSEALAEDRMIQIQLPDTYHRDIETDFPVLYVLDGEYAFSYIRGSVSFLSNSFGHLPKMIVVGIPNTDRAKDFYFTLSNDLDEVPFLNFIEQDLKPYIDKNYRTNGYDILYGWSSASNINMVALDLMPTLFDAHILTGSGVGENGKAYLEKRLDGRAFSNIRMFVTTENPGPRVPYLERFERTLSALAPEGLDAKFIALAGSHVDNIAGGFDAGLRYIFEGYYIPATEVEKGFDNIINYYQTLNDNYPGDFKIPEGAIIEIVTALFGMKKYDDIEKLLNHGLKIYPQSSDLYATYAEALGYMGRAEEGKALYQKAYLHAKSDSQKLKYSAILNQYKSKAPGQSSD